MGEPAAAGTIQIPEENFIVVLARFHKALVRAAMVAIPSALVLGVYVSSATATPIATINGVPLCDGQNGRPAHDPTKWHPLVAKDASGNIICTYGHEHGMDPTRFDNVFGPLPLAQQISYPWATITSTGVQENSTADKHRVYKWIGAENMQSCGLTDFRAEFHDDGNLGATARFHSYWIQGRVKDCSTGAFGTFNFGGHQDYAHLTAGGQIVPVPGDIPAACELAGSNRGEAAPNGHPQNAVWYGATSRGVYAGQQGSACDDWYGLNPHITLVNNIGTDSFGPVDPNNPSQIQLWPPSVGHAETVVGTDVIGIDTSAWRADSNGHNVSGFVNRHGIQVPACSPQSADCVAVTFTGQIHPGSYNAPAAPGKNSVAYYDGDVPGPHGERGFYVQPPDLTGSLGVDGGGTNISPSGPATPTPTSVPATATPTSIPGTHSEPAHCMTVTQSESLDFCQPTPTPTAARSPARAPLVTGRRR
jgi:hypothetical protein